MRGRPAFQGGGRGGFGPNRRGTGGPGLSRDRGLAERWSPERIEDARAARGVIDLPREVVLARIASHAARYPNLDPKPLDADRMSMLDAAFAHALYDGCLRHWRSLGAVIHTACGKAVYEQHPLTQAALMVGAVQLLVLDRVPPHAAVDSMVEWIKASMGVGASRFVNAALRRVADICRRDSEGVVVRVPWAKRRDQFPLSDGRALQLAADCYSPDRWIGLAEATSHTQGVADHWRDRFGEEKALELLAHDLFAAPTIVNGRADPSVAEEACLTPHSRDGYYVFNGDRAAMMSLLDRKTKVRVQDPTAGAAVALLVESGVMNGVRTPLVLDVCAGQGTKSRQVVAELSSARVIASDVEARRMEILERLAGVGAGFEACEAKALRANYTGTADVVLLDVPCSNSGVLARRLEARYRLDGSEVGRMVTLQKTIIADAMRLLKPGGVMVYSTCSIEREENEDQARGLMEAGFSLISERATLPAGVPGDAPAAYHDGGYAVLLRAPKQT